MKDTRFKKGNVPHNAGKKGYVNKGSFKRGHKRLNDALEEWRKNGGVVWNKGIKKATNTGRTRFKKGSTSGEKNANWKGGISKTKAYKNFYKKQYKVNRKSASGSHTFGEWELLKKQYNNTCVCCNKEEPKIVLTRDHIIPLSKGGSNNIENIQPRCRSCNSRKHTKMTSYIGDKNA